MPVNPAGWRIDPPVSLPRARAAMPVATATADPPLLPPGTRWGSHGFRVGPNPEFSVDDPIANSSKFVLPRIIAPASLRRETTVASYGGTHPARMREAHVVGIPVVQRLSLTATGSPASGGRVPPRAYCLSHFRAASNTCARSTCKKACSVPSKASMRSRHVRIRSLTASSRRRRRVSRSLAGASIRGGLRLKDRGNSKVAVLVLRSGRQDYVPRQWCCGNIVSDDVRERDYVRGRLNVLRLELGERGAVVQNAR